MREHTEGVSVTEPAEPAEPEPEPESPEPEPEPPEPEPEPDAEQPPPPALDVATVVEDEAEPSVVELVYAGTFRAVHPGICIKIKAAVRDKLSELLCPDLTFVVNATDADTTEDGMLYVNIRLNAADSARANAKDLNADDIQGLMYLASDELMKYVTDDRFHVQLAPGSIRVSVAGLPEWAAVALASIALGGALKSSYRASLHQRIHAILSEEFVDVATDLPTVSVNGATVHLPAPKHAEFVEVAKDLPTVSVNGATMKGGGADFQAGLAKTEFKAVKATLRKATLRLPSGEEFFVHNTSGRAGVSPAAVSPVNDPGKGPPVRTPEATLKARTLIILDWDDTLLTTTRLTSRYSVFGPGASKSLPTNLTRELALLEEDVLRLLNACQQRGRCVIVTNAARGWIQQSGRRFVPRVVKHLVDQKISVVSAQAAFAASCPSGDPADWKKKAFLRELTGSNINMISIGDSIPEREAAHFASKQSRVGTTKTVKFVDSPTIEQLRMQLTTLTGKIDMICLAEHSFDVDMEL